MPFLSSKNLAHLFRKCLLLSSMDHLGGWPPSRLARLAPLTWITWITWAAPPPRLAWLAPLTWITWITWLQIPRSQDPRTQDRLAHVERVGPSKQRGLEWQDDVAPIIEAG